MTELYEARAQMEQALADQQRFVRDGWWESDGVLFDGSSIRQRLADAGRALLDATAAASAPVEGDEREAIADEISGIQVGSGYESVTIGIDAALEAADALIAAGFRRPSAPTEEDVERAARAIASRYGHDFRGYMGDARAALSAVHPEVTP